MDLSVLTLYAEHSVGLRLCLARQSNILEISQRFTPSSGTGAKPQLAH